MNVVRAFVAIELSPEIKEKLQQVSERLSGHLAEMPVRWTRIENIHLTLKFLGDVSENNLTLINETLESAAAGHKGFALSIGGLGLFPSAQRPRVVWVGVEASQELDSLQQHIENDTARLGYAAEKRGFSPHLTIGRVSRSASNQEVQAIGKLLAKEKLGYLGAQPVGHIHVFQSELKPSGAVYTTLFSAPLSGAE